uniref:Uncharacterized protein n=1 Tax=Grammatophora oceanica TaxID=210454 RepID=A0A7S1V661_9STRA
MSSSICSLVCYGYPPRRDVCPYSSSFDDDDDDDDIIVDASLRCSSSRLRSNKCSSGRDTNHNANDDIVIGIIMGNNYGCNLYGTKRTLLLLLKTILMRTTTISHS